MIKLRRDENILFCGKRPVLLLRALDTFDYEPSASTFWLELSLEPSDTVVWWVLGDFCYTDLRVFDFVPSRLSEEFLDIGIDPIEWTPVFVTLWYR